MINQRGGLPGSSLGDSASRVRVHMWTDVEYGDKQR